MAWSSDFKHLVAVCAGTRGLVAAAVADMTTKGPEVISLPMTSSLCVYSALFMRFAWDVAPRNYLLLSLWLLGLASPASIHALYYPGRPLPAAPCWQASTPRQG